MRFFIALVYYVSVMFMCKKEKTLFDEENEKKVHIFEIIIQT